MPEALRELLGAGVCLAGPVAHSWHMPDSRLGIIVFAGVLASLAMWRVGPRWSSVRVLLAVAAGAAVWPSEGEWVAAWLAGSLLVVDAGVRRRPALPGLRPPGVEVVPPVWVLLVASAWVGRDSLSTWRQLVFVAGAWVLVVLDEWIGPRMGRAAGAVGRGAGAVVGRVLFAVLGVLVVVVPWLVQRILGIDPLRADRGAPSTWWPRARVDVRPRESWAPEAVARERSARAVLRGAAGAVAAACVVMAPIGWFVILPRLDDSLDVPAAYAGEDWYPEYAEDVRWVLRESVAFRPLLPLRVADVRTRHVNVVDGRRATWAPPDCTCPRLTVWIYGGSTTFGIGQRDHHTIPSELARVAWEEGFALDVSNRGVPGHLHWVEAHRFAWDVAVSDPPDLVIFYDGVNELWGAIGLNSRRLPDDDQPYDPLVDEIWRAQREQGGRMPPAPPGGSLVEPTTVPMRSDGEVGRLAVTRYIRARRMSQAVAEANDLTVRWFWQPSRLSRPPIPGEPDEGSFEASTRYVYETAERGVPAGVEDLTGVFDDHDEPLFSDNVHHNEVGARIVAQEMFRRIRPDLERLVADR